MKLKALHVFILCLVLLCLVVMYSQNYKEGNTTMSSCTTEYNAMTAADATNKAAAEAAEDAEDAEAEDATEAATEAAAAYDAAHSAYETCNGDENSDESDESGGDSYNTYNSYGVASSQIPSGDDDLYILKSEIVPPVCPACPTSSACPREKPCQPCPPCARCPEPSFECKKVPNYDSHSAELPKPVLNDFSQFGNQYFILFYFILYSWLRTVVTIAIARLLDALFTTGKHFSSKLS